MATLTINTNIISALSINGSFYGILYPQKPITIPLPAVDTYFCAVPQDSEYCQLNYFIVCQPSLKLLPSSGRLCRWSEDTYELFFVFERKTVLPPPVILKQEKWGEGIVGLAGGYFVYEDQKGCTYYPEATEDYLILSNEHTVLKGKNALTVIDRKMNAVLKRDCSDFKIENGILTLKFTPGDMDFFTVEQRFDKKLISTEIAKEECSCTFDRLRCFCQAVRLDIKDSALNFLTPSLREQMSFESIKDFLGVFDQTDRCRYLADFSENIVALRYRVDECNFHYMCYRFTVDTTTGAELIDDICEI